jgi:hypothetical protein
LSRSGWGGIEFGQGGRLIQSQTGLSGTPFAVEDNTCLPVTLDVNGLFGADSQDGVADRRASAADLPLGPARILEIASSLCHLSPPFLTYRLIY